MLLNFCTGLASAFSLAVRFRCLIVAAVIVTSVSAAPPATTTTVASKDRVEAIRQSYVSAQGDVAADYNEAMDKLVAQYRQALEAYRKQRQQAGALEDTTVILREQERLKNERSLPAEAGGAHKGLAALQKPFIQAQVRCLDQKDSSLRKLVLDYAVRLEAGKKALTIAGQIDEAVAADEELKAVKSSSEWKVAEAAAAANAAEPDAAHAEPHERPLASAEPPEYQMSGRCRLYSGVPPALSGVDLKTVALHQTEMGRLGALNFAAMIGEQSRTERFRITGYNVITNSRETDSVFYIRVQMKPISGRPDVTNAHVVVQYFVRPAIKGSKNVPPQEFALEYAGVDRLGTKQMTVDFPPLTIHKAVVERSALNPYSKRFDKVSFERGFEYYGVLVTVFGSDQSVIYQAGSNPNLDSFARTTPVLFRDRLAKDELPVQPSTNLR